MKGPVEFYEKEKSQSKNRIKKNTFNQNFIFPRIEEGCVKYFKRDNRGGIDERERKKKKSSPIKFTWIRAPLKNLYHSFRKSLIKNFLISF